MHDAVPNLTTAQTAPLLRFESLLLERAPDIEAWFRRQWLRTAPPFYGSVDLRNAGFKLAPVDTNLFPAGFNNLNPAFEALCVQAMQAALDRVMPSACGVLLVPENHTRNLFYLENVAVLRDLLHKAGYKVRIGSLRPELHAPETLQLPSGRELLQEPLRRNGDKVGVDGFEPCVVLLNNDLSAGRPAILENLAQPVIPPLGVGWSTRLKTHHFGIYREVAREFGALLEIDPWLVDPLFRNCGQINFKTREGEDCLAGNVELLLEEIRTKYEEYGVKEEPFVIVKADAGTYGMGVMTVRSPDEIRNLNRDARKKMAATKEGKEVTGAIIQEGVYTFERWGEASSASGAAGEPAGATAEPVVYMIDHYVVGGFYRVHGGRSNQENLNAPGSSFKPLAFAE
ncbi:MAG: glutamate--cysteine ligase, partial [Nevskia sp.]|nr:glutamate--cysteine ligase [Nevskia sp.]